MNCSLLICHKLTCKYSNQLTLEQWAFEKRITFILIHTDYATQGNIHEVEWDMDTSWQLRDLRGAS